MTFIRLKIVHDQLIFIPLFIITYIRVYEWFIIKYISVYEWFIIKYISVYEWFIIKYMSVYKLFRDFAREICFLTTEKYSMHDFIM